MNLLKTIKNNVICVILITIIIIGLIGIFYLSDEEGKVNYINSMKPVPSINNPQTPYVLKSNITNERIIPTPTPLYYEEIKYPTEPCSQTLSIFQTKCMGRIKDEGYCNYWEYQTRKNCKFIQW